MIILVSIQIKIKCFKYFQHRNLEIIVIIKVLLVYILDISLISINKVS